VTVNARAHRGSLFVISAPSGTGKTSLVLKLLERVEGLRFSVSYTTRPMRAGERDAVDYHFVDDRRFTEMVAEGAFLEHAEVFGRRYGTGRDATVAALDAGTDLVLEIDVQGAAQIRASGLGTVSVFVVPPSYAELVRRLRRRGSDDDAQIARRLETSRLEAGEYRYYDYVVVNDEFDRALDDLAALVRAERLRRERRVAEIEAILETFPGPGADGA
jgi:guanylate kinase